MNRERNRIKPFEFDWDVHNKEKNWTKHKVDFRESEEIFFNKPVKSFQDFKHSVAEKRFLALGVTNRNRRLTIIYTFRNNKIRIISARNMNNKERRVYEKK